MHKYKKNDYLICYDDSYPYDQLVVERIESFDDSDLYRVRYLNSKVINYWSIEALESSTYVLNIKKMRKKKLKNLNENQMYK